MINKNQFLILAIACFAGSIVGSVLAGICISKAIADMKLRPVFIDHHHSKKEGEK